MLFSRQQLVTPANFKGFCFTYDTQGYEKINLGRATTTVSFRLGVQSRITAEKKGLFYSYLRNIGNVAKFHGFGHPDVNHL
jgi:hypothetical protein